MKKSLFVIDDDQDLQKILSIALKHAGYEVHSFANAYPILESEVEVFPDLFILDIELPGVNGLEVCKWIKTHDATCSIPVILMSGAPYLKVLAENVKANEYIEKPFEMPALLRKIQQCLSLDLSLSKIEDV